MTSMVIVSGHFKSLTMNLTIVPLTIARSVESMTQTMRLDFTFEVKITLGLEINCPDTRLGGYYKVKWPLMDTRIKVCRHF